MHRHRTDALLDSIAESLRCRICLEMLGSSGRPERLPCDHAFCRACLAKTIEAAGEKNAKCPLCNAEITRRTAKEDGQLARLARAFERVRGAFAARPAGAPPFRGRLPRCFGRDSDSDEAASEDEAAAVPVGMDETPVRAALPAGESETQAEACAGGAAETPSAVGQGGSAEPPIEEEIALPDAATLAEFARLRAEIAANIARQGEARAQLEALLPRLAAEGSALQGPIRERLAQGMARAAAHAAEGKHAPRLAGGGADEQGDQGGASPRSDDGVAPTRAAGAAAADSPPFEGGYLGSPFEGAAAAAAAAAAEAEAAAEAATEEGASEAASTGPLAACSGAARSDAGAGEAFGGVEPWAGGATAGGATTCMEETGVETVQGGYLGEDGAGAETNVETGIETNVDEHGVETNVEEYAPLGGRQEAAPEAGGRLAACLADTAESPGASPAHALPVAQSQTQLDGPEETQLDASPLQSPPQPIQPPPPPPPHRSPPQPSPQQMPQEPPSPQERPSPQPPQPLQDPPQPPPQQIPQPDVAPLPPPPPVVAPPTPPDAPPPSGGVRGRRSRLSGASGGRASSRGLRPVVRFEAAPAPAPVELKRSRRGSGGAGSSGQGGGGGGGSGGGGKGAGAHGSPRDVFEFTGSPPAAAAPTGESSEAVPRASRKTRGGAARTPLPSTAAAATAAAAASAAAASPSVATTASAGCATDSACGGTAPDDASCAVCGEEDSFEDNPIVLCDRCDLAVHQNCYGVHRLPQGEWLCDPCAAGETTSTLGCPGCPRKGGALKRTRDGEWGGWAHVVCTLFLPETGFLEPEALDRAAGFDLIHPDRKKLKCHLCDDAGDRVCGGKIQCTHGRCQKAFHPTCGMAHGLTMQITDEGNIGYCAAHAPGAPAKARAQGQRRKSKA